MKSIIILTRKFIPVSFLLFGFLLMAAIANAQQPGNGKTTEERAALMTEKMKTELSLTDEQYQKVSELNLQYAKKNEQILKSNAGKLSKYRSLQSSQKQKSKAMKGVLTKEQYKKYEQMSKEMKDNAKERYRNRQD